MNQSEEVGEKGRIRAAPINREATLVGCGGDCGGRGDKGAGWWLRNRLEMGGDGVVYDTPGLKRRRPVEHNGHRTKVVGQRFHVEKS